MKRNPLHNNVVVRVTPDAEDTVNLGSDNLGRIVATQNNSPIVLVTFGRDVDGHNGHKAPNIRWAEGQSPSTVVQDSCMWCLPRQLEILKKGSK